MRILISLLVLAGLTVAGGSALAQSDGKSPRFPAQDNDAAWKTLRGENPPLPAWALVLAEPLPRTTAAMLTLNYVHRAKNPLGPILAGKLHWAAADAIGCTYAKRYAEADLHRAGLAKDDLGPIGGDPKKLPYPERIAVAFARKLTKAAYTVTDDEVAELLKEFGPEKVVAMVHTLAWANFQNRIILALGVEVEREGPLPPLELQLDAGRQAKLVAPDRPTWKEAQAAPTAVKIGRPDWRALTEADLASALEQQMGRKPRIPLPKPAEGAKAPSKIVWTHVSNGYQPLLAQTWSACLRAFQQESKMDQVFANAYFWVITRTNECFY